MRSRCKLLPPALTLTVLLAAGCALRPGAPPAAPAPSSVETPAPHLGTPYDVVSKDSLLTILVYRGGTLASAGHNHVIASHDLAGTIYVPAEPLRASFELHLPVDTMTVDEPALRAEQPSADFPPGVSDSAREGTRHNMLGPALLDAGNNPEIVLRAVRMERAPDPGAVRARVQCSVRGQVRTLEFQARFEHQGDRLVVSGETPLRQSELGLTPFTALLGALQVQDEMRVSFRIAARAAGTSAR